jgi:hypothetical protein
MMIAYCFLCQTAYQIGGDPLEVDRLLDTPEWKESLPCATDRCLGRAARVSLDWVTANTDKVRKVEGIPLDVYYRAINGFGRPDQSPADLPAVKLELITKKIASVVGYSVGDPERTILNKLVMEDGTMLHFASSTHGACIFAISKPGPTCVEVFDDQLAEATGHLGVVEPGDRQAPEGERDSVGASPVGGADREEVGRGDEDTEGAGTSGPYPVVEPHRPGVPIVSERSTVHPNARRRG